jgi:hypothetical protein
MSTNLYTLTDKGVYLTRLADDIDPERTNINVPNIHKKVLEYGFENRGVLQRVAGQCHDPYLGPEINRGIDSGKLF